VTLEQQIDADAAAEQRRLQRQDVRRLAEYWRVCVRADDPRTDDGSTVRRLARGLGKTAADVASDLDRVRRYKGARGLAGRQAALDRARADALAAEHRARQALADGTRRLQRAARQARERRVEAEAAWARARQAATELADLRRGLRDAGAPPEVL
jgi:hypothetical protein